MPRKKQTPLDTTLSNYTVYTARDEVDRDFGTVELYSTLWCRHGEEIRRYLDNHHVIHTYYDCDDEHHAERAAKIASDHKFRFKTDHADHALPVVRIKDRTFVRPTIAELEKVLLIEDTQARELFDVVIIGGGVSGATAARHCALLGLKTILLERNIILGKLADLPWIAHTASFPDGIEGRELAMHMRLDLEENSSAIIVEGVNVKRLKRIGGLFEVSTDGAIYRTRSVILATGANPTILGAAGERGAYHRGIYYDLEHDRDAARGRRVVVIGADDETYRLALRLEATELSIIDLRPKTDLAPVLTEELAAREVTAQNNSRILEMRSSATALEAIKYVNEATHKTYIRETDVAFVRLPNRFETRWLAPAINLDDTGRILSDSFRTTWDGVFAIGDCTRRTDLTPHASEHEGAVAAHFAQRFLASWSITEQFEPDAKE